MSGEIFLGLIGTVVSVVGVAIGYLQYRHAKEESSQLRALIRDRDTPSQVAVPEEVREAPKVKAPVAPPPPPAPKINPIADEVPVAANLANQVRTGRAAAQHAGLEAALTVARNLSSAYDRDKKRVELFDEALRRRQYALAASVISDLENNYDRERCKEQLAESMLRLNNPALALEVAQILSGKQA